MTNGKIVDTSVWIDYFNAVIDERTDTTEELVKGNKILMLPVIIQEVLQGIRSQKLFELIKYVFLSQQYVSYNQIEIAISAAALYRDLKGRGITIRKPNDCLIAAICIKHNIEVLHNDKDFDNIAKYTSLKIYKYKN